MSNTTTFGQSLDGYEFRPVGLVAEIESPQDIVRSSSMRIEPPHNKKERVLISQVRTSKTLDDASKQSLLPLVDVFVPIDPSTGKQMKPLAQLNDSRLGSSDFAEWCKTCHKNNADCPGHKADVQLPHPVCPSPFVPFVRRTLVSICYFCSELLTSSLQERLPPVSYNDDLSRLSLVQLDKWKQERQHAFHSATSHMLAYSTNGGLSQPAPICCNCGMPQPIYIAAGCNINAKWPPPSEEESYSDVNWKPSEKVMRRFISVLHRSFASRGGVNAVEFVERFKTSSDHGYSDTCAMRDMIHDLYLSSSNDSAQAFPTEILPCRSADALVMNLLQIPLGRETREERWALRAMTLISAPMRNKLFQSTFTFSDGYHVLSGLSHATTWRMGFNPVTNAPKFMIFTHLPIAGKGARPATTESTGSSLKSENSMTTQYRDVLKHIALLRAKLSMLAVECAMSLSVNGGAKRGLLYGSRNVITGQIIGVDDDGGSTPGDDDLNLTDKFDFTNVTDRRMPAMPMWMRCRDARSIMQFNLDSEATQHLSNLAFKISSMMDSKASAKKSGGHNSGKTGAKNSAKTQNETKNVLESMRIAAAAEHDTVEDYAHVVEKAPPTRSKSSTKKKTADKDNPSSSMLNAPTSTSSLLAGGASHAHSPLTCACREIFHSLANFRQVKGEWEVITDNNDDESAAPFEQSMSMVWDVLMRGGCTAAPTDLTIVEKRGFANPSPHIPAYGKQATSKPLDKILNGKHARIRGHLLSKRGDGTDRCVMSTCANVPVDAVGTPYASCKVQTIPHRVTRANIDALKECIRIGSGALDGASKIVTSENKIIYIPKRTKRLETEPFLKIGWTVHAHIRHGDTVILNRQPSLHRGNHNSRKVVRTAGKTDQTNENSVTRFNGDYDGDEVNKQFSQSIEARADEILCMGIAYNLVNPRTASLFTSLHENTLLGAFLLSEGSTFLNKEQASMIIGAIRMITKKRRDATTYHGFVKDEKYRYRKNIQSDAYVPMANDLPQLKPDAPPPGWSLPEPCILKPTPMWSGKQLLSMLLPNDVTYVAATLDMDYTDGVDRGTRRENDDAFERALFKDKHARLVCITADYWLAGDGNKDVFGGSQTSIIKHIWQHYGQQYACDLISDWCVMVHEYLKIRGFSVGAADFMLAGVPSPERLAEWMQQRDAEEAAQQVQQEDAANSSRRRRPPSAEIEFHKHALRQKENMVQALNSAYDEVRAFIISPEIMSLLTRSDIDNARRRVEAYINDVAPRYITAMTLSFTDSRKNGASLMAASGAKGSVGNSSEMETCFGPRSINGALIGSNMSHPRSRNFVHEYPGEFSASSSGFVASSLSSGLTEVEMMQHTMPARHGIYKSSDPKVSGYQQRRMSALAENQTVRSDRTVRDGQQIVQILFGGDGVESIQVQRVHIGPSVLNARPLSISDGDSNEDPLTSCIGKLAESLLTPSTVRPQDPNNHCFARVQPFNDNCPIRMQMIESVARAMRDIDRAVNRCESSSTHSCPSCAAESDAIRRLADNLVASAACRPYNKMASAKAIKEKRGIAAYLPINMREVMNTHAARWRKEIDAAHHVRAEEFVDNYLQSDLYQSSISSPIPVVDSICDALYAEYASGGKSQSSFLSNAVKHASTKPVASHAELMRHVEDLCNALCERMGPSAMPVDLILSVRHALRFNSSLYDVAHASRWHLKCLMQDIYDICSQSAVDAGEPVGIVMCQSISEPTTQLIMRLFKPEFSGASHTQGGITRQDEILNNTKTSVPSIYCALSPQWVSTMEDARFVRDQMVGKKLSHWMDADFAVWMNMTRFSSTTAADSTNLPPLTDNDEMTPSHLLFAPIWSAIQQSYADVAVSNRKENEAAASTAANDAGQGNTKKRKRTATPFSMEDTVSPTGDKAKKTASPTSTTAAAAAAAVAALTVPERHGLLLFKFHDDNVRDGFFADSANSESDDHTSSRQWRSKRVMSQLLSRVLLPWQRGCIIGGPSVHPLCPYYWVVWPLHGVQDCSTWLRMPTVKQADDAWDAYMIGMHELSKTMRSDLLVVGNDGIQECVSISSPTAKRDCGAAAAKDSLVETPEMCYILHLRGSDFSSVLAHPATFDQYCYTSDLRTVEEIFDLESRAQHTVHELSQVYDSGDGNNKIFILPRQFQLLADTTTASAEVTAVNRYGLENKSSFASVLCFERTSSKIVESCVAGRFDPMDDVSPNSMYGARTETIGTSIVEIITSSQPRRGQSVSQSTANQAAAKVGSASVRASVGNENDEDLLDLVAHVCKIRVS